MAETSETELLDLTTVFEVAHVGKNVISVDQISTLIKEVHKALLNAHSLIGKDDMGFRAFCFAVM